MKPRAQKITVIIVFLLVILFGVGQFFARAPILNTNPEGNGASADPQATQVVRYAPPIPASSTPVVRGSCWTNSIAAPYPRRMRGAVPVGNDIQDPCFQIERKHEHASLRYGSGELRQRPQALCSRLQNHFLCRRGSQPAPNNWAWLVELQDGTVCSPFTGTLPFAADHEVAEYGCAPRYQGDDRMIFGDLNALSDVWTAEIGTLSSSTVTFPPPIVASSVVPITEVWQ